MNKGQYAGHGEGGVQPGIWLFITAKKRKGIEFSSFFIYNIRVIGCAGDASAQ